MIKIQFLSDGFVSKGHANYSKKGTDIICSAISAILIGSLNWFDQKDFEISEANLKLKVNNKNDLFKLDLIQLQIKAIQQNDEYKPYLNVEYYNYDK